MGEYPFSSGDMTNTKGNIKVSVVRWIARISAGVMAALILLIFVGEALADGFDPLLNLTIRESGMMMAFFAVWLGLLLGWKWELYGGLLIICGVAAFYLLDYLFSGTFPRGPFFLIFAAPSLLFTYCGWQTMKMQKVENV